MHDIEQFTAIADLSIICVYPADDVRESSSRLAELVISFFHNLALRALKSPVTTEQIGNSSFMLLRTKFWVKKHKYRLKNIFNFSNKFP